jgi:predicted nucleic-acid-binding Zn-ribbon protein
MRNRCPKCDHGEVLHIPNPRDSDFDAMALGGASIGFFTSEAIGTLQAYVCLKCGYTEFYVGDVGGLIDEVEKIAGARVLRAEERSTPYR